MLESEAVTNRFGHASQPTVSRTPRIGNRCADGGAAPLPDAANKQAISEHIRTAALIAVRRRTEVPREQKIQLGVRRVPPFELPSNSFLWYPPPTNELL